MAETVEDKPRQTWRVRDHPQSANPAVICIDQRKSEDGLLADLGHIATASKVSAVVEDAALPWTALDAACSDRAAVRDALLAGGDDYELLFCAPPAADAALAALSARLGLALTRIGHIEAGQGVQLVDASGRSMPVARRGYDHFS